MAETKPRARKPKATVENFLTPGSFIRAARDAHPAFRYVLVVAGVAAIVVAFTNFGTNPATLVFGILAVFALVAVFLVVAQIPRVFKAHMALPALVFVWSVLLIAIASILFLTSSTFFNTPLPIRDVLIGILKPLPMIPPGPGPNPGPGPVPAPAPGPAPEPVPEVRPEPLSAGDIEQVAAEISEIYQAIGQQLALMENWSNQPWRGTLRAEPGRLFITPPDGGEVSMPIDPAGFKSASYASAHMRELGAQGVQVSQPVAEFVAANETFKAALQALGQSRPNFQDAYFNVSLEGKMALSKGRVALCSLGKTPPQVDRIGALAAEFPQSCSMTAAGI